MIWAIDSKPLTAAQIAAAKADGVRMANGYLGDPGDGIDPGHLWSPADFDAVRAAGLASFAYVSGNQDPVKIAARAKAIGIRIAVDVERFIRSDGPWVQAWLDASGAGLYGNLGVHRARRAAFYVVSAYPGYVPNPNVSWVPGATRPPGPCGWQYQGTTAAYGTSIDRSFFDDWFFDLRFSAGQGELDMASADQILAAVTMPLPPKPPSLAGLTDAQISTAIATMTWAAIQTKYGSDGMAYMYAFAHPETRPTVAQATASVAAKVDAMTGLVKTLSVAAAGSLTPAQQAELDQILADVEADKQSDASLAGALAAVKAELDQVKTDVETENAKISKAAGELA